MANKQSFAVHFQGIFVHLVGFRGARAKSTFGQFERFTHNCYVHEVTHDAIEGFLQSLRSKDGVKKAARKTWNNYRAGLHLFFEWCREKPQQYVSVNPVADIKRFEIDRGDIEATGIIKGVFLDFDFLTEGGVCSGSGYKA